VSRDRRGSDAAHTIGGQAVIEGVMMRSPTRWALAVRRPDGGIHTESHPVREPGSPRHWADAALVRGLLALGETLRIGLRALRVSARVASGEDGEELRDRDMAGALGVAFVFFVVLFIVLPAVLVGGAGDRTVVHNLREGAVRIAIFFAYVLAISLLRDVRRVFAYHGAEHKTIAAHEAGAQLTHEGVRPFPTIHVRCGTNFLFLVMLVSAAVFSLVGRDPLWWRVASRIILLPVVAAVSYETLRLAARHPRNAVVRLISWPGLLLQRITTREPADDQLEVALAALQALLEDQGHSHTGTP
jgi:uncharacterized protein YqhQ